MLKRKSPLDFHEELATLYKTGLPPGESTGFKSIDELYTVSTKQWTVITGAPSSGKSEWLDAVAINLIRQGWQIIFFSPENQPHELHITKHLEKLIGKPFGSGPTERMKPKEYTEAAIELANRTCFLTVDDEFAKVPSLAEVFETCVEQINEWRENGSGQKVGIVLDPYNEFDHSRPANLSETEYISQFLSLLRQFARDWDVHVWLVAHPTKLQKGQDGTYPVAKLYDIAGSAHFYNKCDNGISVHRDYQTGEVDIHVLKVRFKNIGKPGTVTLKYDRVTGRYIDPKGQKHLTLIKAGGEPCPI